MLEKIIIIQFKAASVCGDTCEVQIHSYMLVSLQFTGDQQGSLRDPSETKRYATPK